MTGLAAELNRLADMIGLIAANGAAQQENHATDDEPAKFLAIRRAAKDQPKVNRECR